VLGKYLKKLNKNRVTLTFSQVEEILGFDLPQSARIYREWWSNDKYHVQSQFGWLAAGWLVDKVDLMQEMVTFRKVGIVDIDFQESSPNQQMDIITRSTNDFEPKKSDLSEEIAKKVMEEYFGVKLEKRKLNIFGKYKEFDLVNIEKAIVGDVKRYTFRKSTPSAEFSTISEYIWLMEKLEQFTGRKWRKFIVGLGNRSTFETYAKKYGPWIGNVEIYYINENKELIIIRKPEMGI